MGLIKRTATSTACPKCVNSCAFLSQGCHTQTAALRQHRRDMWGAASPRRDVGQAGVAAWMCYLKDFQSVNGLSVPFAGAGVPLLQIHLAKVSVKVPASSTHMHRSHRRDCGPC
jgi:hypothetical protein